MPIQIPFFYLPPPLQDHDPHAIPSEYFSANMEGRTCYHVDKVKNPDICKRISKKCLSTTRKDRLKALICAVAATACSLFAKEALFDFIAAYELLVDGWTLFTCIKLLPLIVLALTPCAMLAYATTVCWESANHFHKQALSADRRLVAIAQYP